MTSIVTVALWPCDRPPSGAVTTPLLLVILSPPCPEAAADRKTTPAGNCVVKSALGAALVELLSTVNVYFRSSPGTACPGVEPDTCKSAPLLGTLAAVVLL